MQGLHPRSQPDASATIAERFSLCDFPLEDLLWSMAVLRMPQPKENTFCYPNPHHTRTSPQQEKLYHFKLCNLQSQVQAASPESNEHLIEAMPCNPTSNPLPTPNPIMCFYHNVATIIIFIQFVLWSHRSKSEIPPTDARTSETDTDSVPPPTDLETAHDQNVSLATTSSDTADSQQQLVPGSD